MNPMSVISRLTLRTSSKTSEKCGKRRETTSGFYSPRLSLWPSVLLDSWRRDFTGSNVAGSAGRWPTDTTSTPPTAAQSLVLNVSGYGKIWSPVGQDSHADTVDFLLDRDSEVQSALRALGGGSRGLNRYQGLVLLAFTGGGLGIDRCGDEVGRGQVDVLLTRELDQRGLPFRRDDPCFHPVGNGALPFAEDLGEGGELTFQVADAERELRQLGYDQFDAAHDDGKGET